MRAVVVGASSGLGRCIGVGLGQRGMQVALLARRRDRLETAVKEAGPVLDTAMVAAPKDNIISTTSDTFSALRRSCRRMVPTGEPPGSCLGWTDILERR